MCVFCDYISRNDGFLFESKEAIVIYDKFPVSTGHILIIPKRHVASFFELKDQELLDIKDLLFLSKSKISAELNPDSFNIGINDGFDAGQTIPHCHIHLIPRYKGDVSNPRGGIRGVIPSKKDY